jgi:hypothetical protein
MRPFFTRRKRLLASLLLFAPVITGALLLFGQNPALAANPTTINFQGKVVDSNGLNVTNGTYSFNSYERCFPGRAGVFLCFHSSL